MKKTKEISNLLIKKLIDLLNHNFNKKDDLDLTANALMGIIFNDRSTEDSIVLIQKLKEVADKELTKRKTLAILEKNCVDSYFNKNTPKGFNAVPKIEYQILSN